MRGEGDAERSPLTVVLMHGFGAPGDDLVALADMIDVPAGTRFVFPEALHALPDFLSRSPVGDARCWWMIDFMKLERAIATGEMRDLSNEKPEGIDDARDAVSAMLDELAPTGPLILGGFSQGAMLSLDIALRTKREIAGLVLLSGTLIAEKEWSALLPSRKGLRIFQSHGTEDVILPYANAERLRDLMAKNELDVTFEKFVGPHAIPPSVLRSLSRWLSTTA